MYAHFMIYQIVFTFPSIQEPSKGDAMDWTWDILHAENVFYHQAITIPLNASVGPNFNALFQYWDPRTSSLGLVAPPSAALFVPRFVSLVSPALSPLAYMPLLLAAIYFSIFRFYASLSLPLSLRQAF